MRLATAMVFAVVIVGCAAEDGDELCADCDLGQWAEEREYCAEVINDFRAEASRPALGRAADLEECATAAARADAQSGEPHGYFRDTGGCGAKAFAENEVPGWSLQSYGSVRDVILRGAQMMYDEGPGGGHYENITNERYSEVGCGIFVTGDDAVWVVHNFR